MAKPKLKLPGDHSRSQMIDQIIRVNHAGEYGAKRIYEGQLAVLKDTDCATTINMMKDQELAHLEYFAEQISKHKARPSALLPFWHISGYLLGAATALLGKEAAMACTVAVEEVIEEHYQSQLNELGYDEPELAAKIAQFREEEIQHKNEAIEHDAYNSPGYSLLSLAIKQGCKLAIWLAKKF